MQERSKVLLVQRYGPGRTLSHTDAATETCGGVNPGRSPKGIAVLFSRFSRCGIDISVPVPFHADGGMRTKPHAGIADGAFWGIDLGNGIYRGIYSPVKKGL